ncbi:hypothetical protein C8J24_1388 [Sphingomonas aerolata]|jgi:GT2 family glycosyltransferase|uniref:Glycosyltransferase 2-like domain-containing protein n=1 Tax=Sphingomonas aerolata TaxID=185951 RepID=A0A2T4YW28_9SPHN|nr:hypothetical protein C8J24_1388 [Sphingomonas aerolata]
MTYSDSHELPRVTLVTVTYNAASVFDDFWQSLSKQVDVEWALIVVDNASVDKTSAKLALIERDPRVTVVRSPINTGAAEGNNIGVRLAMARADPYIILCNNDIVFDSNILTGLIRAKQRLSPGAVSPVLVFGDNRSATWFEMGSFSTLFGVRCVHHSSFDALPSQSYLTSYAPTTFLLFDREVIESVGELDADYFAYWEDADYVWRARKKGYKLWVNPHTVVVHKVSQSSGGFGSLYSNHQYYKNQIRFARKHFGRVVCGYTVATSLLRIGARWALRRDPLPLTKAKMLGLQAGILALRG